MRKFIFLLLIIITLLSAGTYAFSSDIPVNTDINGSVDFSLLKEFAARVARIVRPAVVPAIVDAFNLDETDERIILINYNNPIPPEYFDTLELAEIENGHKMETAAAAALTDMLAAMRDEGLNPVVRSSFRTNAEQRYLFNRQINTQKARGYNDEQAYDAARRINAYPGTSEHEAGLAVDLVDYAYQVLDAKQANTNCGKWLIENSYKYGFILRYPNDKRDITNIIYEPWHYRYVGKDAAAEIFGRGICLEEYHDLLGK